MRLPCCMTRVKNTVKLFFSVSWMAIVMYGIMWKLVYNDTDPPLYSHVAEHINNQYSSLLLHLGFKDEPRLFPQAYQEIDEKEWPIFVLALRSEDVENHLVEFLMSFRTFFLDHRLVIYDLGVSKTQREFVQRRCYCQVRSVTWQIYPDHVSNLKIGAYIPLLLQESLMEFGSVFWCDVRMRFLNKDLKPDLATQARMYGLVTWPVDHYPTSTYTHHSMLRYFNMSSEDVYFQKMARPVPALFYNVKTLHELMLLWIKCALDKNCVQPSGSQGGWCSRKLKPKYLYTGCHKYSTSAFNIALFKLYGSNTPYLTTKQLFDLQDKDDNSMFNIISSVT